MARRWKPGKSELAQAASGEPVIRYFDSEFPIDPADYAHIAECGLESFDPANPSGRCLLHTLLERQHYRLAWWGAAGDEINWRRFFDINGLAGLRIEVPEVFEATHATLFRLYADGLIDGFRVDHVDGLSDPPGYCRRLRQRLDELAPDRHAYLVIEKILGAGEALPADWGVDGTSGYDFMNEVSAVQHDASSAAALGQLWHDLTQRSAEFEDEEVAARQEILLQGFDAQLQAVTAAIAPRCPGRPQHPRPVCGENSCRLDRAAFAFSGVSRLRCRLQAIGDRSGGVRQGAGGGEGRVPGVDAPGARSTGSMARRGTGR